MFPFCLFWVHREIAKGCFDIVFCNLEEGQGVKSRLVSYNFVDSNFKMSFLSSRKEGKRERERSG
jgi:hypothetical protein